MKVIFLILLCCLCVDAQSSNDLHQKYGAPISETFVVQPGITATVSYDAKGQVKEMLVAAPLSLNLSRPKQKPINYDALKSIIDQLVPKKERGKFLGSSLLNVVCLPTNDCQGSQEDYERLTIYYNAADGGDVNYADITWRKQNSAK